MRHRPAIAMCLTLLAASSVMSSRLLAADSPATSGSKSPIAADVATDTHPRLPGFERFFASDDVADGERMDARSAGLLLIGELNCIACHSAGDANSVAAAWLLPKAAPALEQVGQRVRPEFLRAYIESPHHSKPGATMPRITHRAAFGSSDEERKRAIESVVHFLASSGRPTEAAPIRAAVVRGERLFHSVGCAACHDARRDGTAPLAASVPLVSPETKYTIPSLTAFLQDPLAVRPAGRMPHLNLSADESRDIASYLLSGVEVEPNVAFRYYEGSWNELPDFGTLQPKAVGKCNGFDVTVGDRLNEFAMSFDALVKIPRDGEYRIHLGSDDGSRIRIDGRELITVDGIHPLTWKDAVVNLTAGVHEVQIEYFEQGGEEVLRAEIEGPQIARQPLDGFIVVSRDAPAPADLSSDDPDSPNGAPKAEFTVDPSLADQGKATFVAAGCAACHSAAGVARGTMPADATPAATFAELGKTLESAGSRGCLSATPARHGAPDYSLTPRQRDALVAALRFLSDASKPPSADSQIRHVFATFNCYACHVRDGVGGVERPRDELFKGDQPEMGDEGRIPPLLTGVGAKLRSEWLKHVFDNGAKDRPYMFTRMPRFGSQNVGALNVMLAEQDKLPTTPAVETDEAPRRLKSAGRQLVGAAGFSCIKCHTWGNEKATGIQSISMSTMTQRLREDWFMQYMLNPVAFRPGTRMPSAWPDGKVQLPSVLDGKASTQIYSVWTYLADGSQASPPQGLGSEPMELFAIGEAVIYRNFIDGAGSRAIGVGYPERVNLAFDANQFNLALLWHNAFIDASRHWSGRGVGYQPPLGDNVLRLPASPPLARLDEPQSAWPGGSPRELGYRFRGYRLDKEHRPTFLYQFGDVMVEDRPNPDSAEPFAPLSRALTLSSQAKTAGVYYRAAVADKIERDDEGWYTVNGTWRTRVESAGQSPIVRESGGKRELLIPVVLNGGKGEVKQFYSW